MRVERRAESGGRGPDLGQFRCMKVSGMCRTSLVHGTKSLRNDCLAFLIPRLPLECCTFVECKLPSLLMS
jgi:hypothetical protein